VKNFFIGIHNEVKKTLMFCKREYYRCMHGELKNSAGESERFSVMANNERVEALFDKNF